LVHTYGGEPYHNIIINDLDTQGLELLEYRYDTPLYLYRPAEPESPIYTNATIDGEIRCMPQGHTGPPVPLSSLTIENNELDPLMDHLLSPDLKWVEISG